MTVSDFLISLGVDINNNKDKRGNQLTGDMARELPGFDYQKGISNLTDKEKIAIETSLTFYENNSIHLDHAEALSRFNKRIQDI